MRRKTYKNYQVVEREITIIQAIYVPLYILFCIFYKNRFNDNYILCWPLYTISDRILFNGPNFNCNGVPLNNHSISIPKANYGRC